MTHFQCVAAAREAQLETETQCGQEQFVPDDLEPVSQALNPHSPLCLNADRLRRLSWVEAAGVLLPPLKHLLLHPAPQLKPHLCLVGLLSRLQQGSSNCWDSVRYKAFLLSDRG